MKAKEYAKSFIEGRKNKEDPNALLLIIFRDMIREANMIVMRRRLDTIEQISTVFELQSRKWEVMCGILKRYPIARDGFKALFKARAPESYYKMVASNMTPLIEDQKKNNGSNPEGGK